MNMNDKKGGKLNMFKPTIVEDSTALHSAGVHNVGKDTFADLKALYVYICSLKNPQHFEFSSIFTMRYICNNSVRKYNHIIKCKLGVCQDFVILFKG